MDNKKKDVTLLKLGGAFSALLGIVIFAQIAIAIAVQLLLPQFESHLLYTYVLSFVPLYVFGLPPCLIILGKKEDLPKVRGSISPSDFFALIISTIGFSMLANLFGTCLMFVAEKMGANPFENPVNGLLSGTNIYIAFAALVVIAPIGEEFIFRRLIIDRAKKYGELYAVMLSAVMFGAFHMNIYQFFYTFIVGFILAYVYIKKGRLIYSIILHALLNFICGIIPTILLQNYNDVLPLIESGSPEAIADSLMPLLGLLLYLFIMLCCMVAAVVLFFIYFGRVSFKSGETKKGIIFSPLILLFIAICLAITVLPMII